MQGATLNLSGTAVITQIQKSNKPDSEWITAELVEAPSSNASSNGQSWELLPIKARIRVPKSATMPTEGSILEIRSASLSRSEGEYNNQKTAFWNVAIFSWRELASAPAAPNGTTPSAPATVSAKPTISRPVMDDTRGAWDEEVPF